MVPRQIEITDNLDLLLGVLPPHLRAALERRDPDELLEVIVDLGRKPEARFPDGATLYNELRRSLLPEECDTQTITEIRRLLARDITLKEAKRILEKHIIETTLRKTGGNITHAAKELGIHRPQLSNLLKKYALKRELYERDFDIRLNPLDN